MKKHTREGEVSLRDNLPLHLVKLCVCVIDIECTLSYAAQVRFTSCRDRPLHERQAKFIQCLREGFMDIVSNFNPSF